jgi:hypothetical protein
MPRPLCRSRTIPNEPTPAARTQGEVHLSIPSASKIRCPLFLLSIISDLLPRRGEDLRPLECFAFPVVQVTVNSMSSEIQFTSTTVLLREMAPLHRSTALINFHNPYGNLDCALVGAGLYQQRIATGSKLKSGPLSPVSPAEDPPVLSLLETWIPDLILKIHNPPLPHKKHRRAELSPAALKKLVVQRRRSP